MNQQVQNIEKLIITTRHQVNNMTKVLNQQRTQPHPQTYLQNVLRPVVTVLLSVHPQNKQNSYLKNHYQRQHPCVVVLMRRNVGLVISHIQLKRNPCTLEPLTLERSRAVPQHKIKQSLLRQISHYRCH